MSKHAIDVEMERLEAVETIEDYPDFHERHRAIPAIFEDRHHKRIIDTSAGVGCAARRIAELYPGAELVANDITPTCLRLLQTAGIPTVSFDLDDECNCFPFEDGSFDAAISLATIEHLWHVDHFVEELHRILCNDGYLYISAPNYASILYWPRLVLRGRSFHDPLSTCCRERYEFYGHIRYFTYQTLLEFVSSFGFEPEVVYLAIPKGSTHYRELYERSKPKALAFRAAMTTMYRVFSPTWAAEPILCFRRADEPVGRGGKPRKVLL